MKIGIVCPYDMFKGGGVQEIVRAQYEGLVKRGHTVRIITPKPYKYDGKVPAHYLLVGSSADFKTPFATVAQVSRTVDAELIDDLLAREAFDVLHFHEPWMPMLSRQLLIRSRAVNIATFHAKLPETMMSRTIEKVITPYTKSVVKYFDGLTAVSQAAASYVRSLTDRPITIIPNGIDLDKYRVPPKTDSKQTQTIFYVGRLEKRKGVKYLIEAFHILAERNPHVRLIIAGDGPDREKLQKLVEEEHVHRVTFKGYIKESEKIRLMSEADVFCSPALFGESFGIVLLEAMAVGTPTVAGNNVGYATVMTDTGRLSLVNPRESEEFARRLELFLEDTQVIKLWKTWAKDHVQLYSYDKVINAYEKFYQSNLNAKTTTRTS